MDIVPLKKSDFAIAVDCLATAFNQDPLISHGLPDSPEAKQVALEKMSQGVLNFAQVFAQTYTTAGGPKGVAVWQPPEESDTSWAQLWSLVGSGMLKTPLFFRWDRIPDMLWLLSTLATLHKKLMPDPHWYLIMLGVAPQYQGQGIGGELIQPILEQADRDQVPCYLETTTPAAMRFYERRGFQTIHQDFFAGHSYWAMKRSPQDD
ncbi:MAG: GNAT family N-acetyltransferase [Cyanophyceae cyanobacterium]